MKTIAQLIGEAGVYMYSVEKMMKIYDFEKTIAQVRINNKVDADQKLSFQQLGAGLIKNLIQRKKYESRNFFTS